MTDGLNEGSHFLHVETMQFCHNDVLEPWLQVLRCNRGDASAGWLRPMLALGPPLPMGLVPHLLDPGAVRALLGSDPNLVTVVTDRQRQTIVYLAVERAENGRYLEMVRIDRQLQPGELVTLARCIAAGNEAEAMRLVRAHLGRLGLGVFRPGVMKVADLRFFDEFCRLAQVKRQGSPGQWLAAAAQVAGRVLSERLLYFYPAVPAERLLRLGRRLALAG